MTLVRRPDVRSDRTNFCSWCGTKGNSWRQRWLIRLLWLRRKLELSFICDKGQAASDPICNKGRSAIIKGLPKPSQQVAQTISMKGVPVPGNSNAKGAVVEQGHAEASRLQQIFLELSSEKSCQEQLGRNSAATSRGCAQNDHGEGSSSQGSEPSHRPAWQEKGEQTWESATPRCAGHTCKVGMLL